MTKMEQRFPSSNRICTYDVFLSFRGEDTRYGFTGTLYHALNQGGIKTFMDDEVIKRGEQISPTIFKAIQESRIAIIVFSKTYASSKWCLQELVKIIACYRDKELVVIPVFYNVDPSEVRNHTGNYGRQLAMHEEKMKEEVKIWRLALREASNLAGWRFKDGHEYEYEFIKRIADTVHNTSKQNLSHVDDYAIGLESRMSKILYRLQMANPTVIMMGICGFGGIGKTTLARAVYDSIGQQFEGLCFLYDVREHSTKYGLAYLQQLILSDTVGENIKLRNENEGLSVLIRKLQNKRILLILDDVDKLDQLKSLAGTPNWFGWGSRIIITSRHEDILAAHGVGNIYDVPAFDYYEALQLLSSIASKRPNPDGVWNRAISYSRGLPLVLKIIGSDLLEKSTDEWEISLDRYGEVRNEETQSILEVSYNSLSVLEKRIFLDITCFFTGEPLPYVEEILSACGFYTKYGIDRLKERSLISITLSGNLMVHDHIIDMAMNIVQQESPTNPCQRTRLWLPEDVLRVLDENAENDKIEVMILDNLPQGSVEKLSDKAFKEMKSLRILIIKDAVYSEVLQHLPDSLRVLDWDGYPSCCLPPDFVKLPSSCLIFNKFESMKYLVGIDFTDCIYITEVPDMSGIPNLMTLYLDNCINVTKIHDSVGFLDCLLELTATGCTNLETIPEAFKLASLNVLSFSECPKLARFPEILCKIKNLRHINLWQTGIEELPFSIGNVTGLEVLTLMECTRLDKLPSSIFTLPRLQEIQADSCKGFDISTECDDNNGPVKFTASPNKVHLYLSSCNLTDDHLFICLSGFANVVHLDLSYNSFTVLPPCIKECIKLNTLLLTNCNQLQDISEIPPNLIDIDAVNCTSLTSQSQSVLLSQAFHETGERRVILPGSGIPEWFDHCSSERSISFYAHERFPSICVCVVFGMLEKLPHHFLVKVCLIINGHKTILSQCSSWSIVREHVWVFDLRALISCRETWLKRGWNHVEISCEDCDDEHLMAQAVHGLRRRTIVNWYNDFNNEVKDFGRLVYAEDCLLDLFPLQLRIFVSWETSSLVANISQKENVPDFYKKACDIFNSAYNSLYIWDFSGQTTQLLINDKARVSNDSPGQPGKEVLLELQVHGLSDSLNGSHCNGMISDRSQMECSSSSGPVMMNGSTDNVIPYVTANNYFPGSSYRTVQSMGLTGLQNLGNTCFMNSAIQCLAHTPKLVDFFLGDYRREINYENPLGMNGELALAFGDLLRMLWVPGASPVAPRLFKMKLSNFAPQFSGYMQHDSQELLAFLLDGLHEDLNHVKRKPYHEVKDADGRPDEEVAEEYWRNHLARNDSVVVDLCQGQFRSTLICPFCEKVSITFDPFMYLSLPLPSTTIRTMTVTVVSTDGITLPSAITVTVPERGTLKDLIGALTAFCSLREDETLLVAEIYKNRIFRELEDPSDSLADIRDKDKLVAYRVQKYNEDSLLIVFMHEHLVESYGRERFENRFFGIPVVARLSDITSGYDVRKEFLNLINPFLIQDTEETIDEYDKDDDDTKILNEVDEFGETNNSEAIESDAVLNSGAEDDIHLWTDFEFYLLLSSGRANEVYKITSNDPLPVTMLSSKLEVVVVWSDKMLKKYDTNLLDSLPEVFDFSKKTQESISIYKCLEAFLREEPLGPEDMWYCPTCKKPQQATKKLDLWRLPKILVVHLKRFSYDRFFKNKLETFVDFPINDLDLSTYVAHRSCPSPYSYMLYAIICHYGGLGGGHYTAFVRYGHDKWYEFDDSRVAHAEEETIKTPAAYVLFYKKI